MLEAKIKAYLNAGDRDTAGKFALDLKRAKDDLAENEKQLALHEQAYQNNLLKIQHAIKKLDDVKHKISKYDAELKMSRAEAEMAALANQFHFDVTTDFGQAEQMLQDQIDKNRAKVRVAADLSGEGVEEIQREMAVEKTMADDALREFEVSQGLATPETSQGVAVDQGTGPGGQDPRAAPRDLSSQQVPRRSQKGRRPWRLRPPTPPVFRRIDIVSRADRERSRARPSPGFRAGPASSPTSSSPARPASSCCTATSTT